MTEVVILGSGTPVPTPGRAGPATAIVHDDQWVLFDCGRGATQRALDAGLKLTSLLAVAITHQHSDHISDLATLAMARWTDGAHEPLTVVAPAGSTSEFVTRSLHTYPDDALLGQSQPGQVKPPAINVVTFTPTVEPQPVWSSADWQMSAALVDHGPVAPAVGYRSSTDCNVMISGDTRVCEGVRKLAVDNDVIVHEALLAGHVRDDFLVYNACARTVGDLAAQVRPRVLILTHLLPAPVDAVDEQVFVAQARSGGFAGQIVVASDLLRVQCRPTDSRGGGQHNECA